MPHIRTQIREKAIELLGDLAVTLTRSRIHNFQPGELPGIAVYTLSEENDTEDTPRRTMVRVLTLRIDIFAGTTGDVDTDIDALAVEVEKALEADDEGRFGGLANDSELRRTTIGLSDGGDRHHATCRLEYEVEYWTPAGAPDLVA